MKLRIFIGLCISCVIFFSPVTAFAHTAGQMPFFKVNGVFSNLYSVPTTSLNDFGLPQDDSPDLYLVNQSIDFELDTARLPIPQEILQSTTFNWDFGDGSKKSGGLKESHVYSKSGSYILEISAQTKQISEPQLLQSTIIHVVPTKPYQLPKSIIHVNGQSVKDPLVDVIKIEFGQDFTLDATSSLDGSGKIVSFQWDLGDGKTDSNPLLTYVYKKEQYAYFPVLRVKDSNGLISDSFLQVTNSLNDLSSSKPSQGDTRPSISRFIYPILGGFILIILWGVSFPVRKKLLHKSKH